MADEIVLDLETQRAFSEVGGRQNFSQLKVSLCGIYSYSKDKFLSFREDRLGELVPILTEAKRIIGFNIRSFDFPVLQPYVSIDLQNLAFLDLLEEITQAAGRRIKLDSIASATLGTGKSGDGLDALRFFKEGDWESLERYCLDDVRITKQIYEFGKRHGHVFYVKGNQKDKIDAQWARGLTISEQVRQAYREKRRILIEYPYSDKNGQPLSMERKIEIYYIKDDLMACFCHLRQQDRTFRISRILNCRFTYEPYSVPPTFNLTAWEENLKRL